MRIHANTPFSDEQLIGQPPPFALAQAGFRFRALASHAGRASLGGDREVAFACFGTARLASAMLPPFALSPADSATRTAATRQWLSSLAVPGVVRAALNNVVDAVGDGNRQAVAAALTSLVDVASAQLDGASAGEIRDLATELA